MNFSVCTLHGRRRMFFWYQGSLYIFGVKYNEHTSCVNMYYIFKGKGLLFIYFQGDKFSAGECVDLGFLKKKSMSSWGLPTWLSSSFLGLIVLLTCLSVRGIVCLFCWRILIKDFIFGPLLNQNKLTACKDPNLISMALQTLGRIWMCRVTEQI